MLRLVDVGIPRSGGTAVLTTAFAGNGHVGGATFLYPLDVVRNVIQTYVFDQGERVPCIGEAAAVKLEGNQELLRRDPDIDGFR
jgi:hypothetical protein